MYFRVKNTLKKHQLPYSQTPLKKIKKTAFLSAAKLNKNGERGSP
jgi:hypothetical protein